MLIVASIELLSGSDKIKSDIQNDSESPSISRVTNIPDPGGIVVAERLKAMHIDELKETESPASEDAPPDAFNILPPLTLNWKPAMGMDTS